MFYLFCIISSCILCNRFYNNNVRKRSVVVFADVYFQDNFVFVIWQTCSSSIRDPHHSSSFSVSLFIVTTAILYCVYGLNKISDNNDKFSILSWDCCRKKFLSIIRALQAVQCIQYNNGIYIYCRYLCVKTLFNYKY